jgi:hypothetical protein
MNQPLAFFKSSTTLIASTIIIGIPIICLSLLHARLSQRIHHTTKKGTLTATTTDNVDSIPDAILNKECSMIHDYASRPVRKDLLPALDTNTLLTIYLRRNMVRFSSLPQAWALRSISNSSTFKKSYIENLEFKDGDVVCGAYRIVLRTEEKAELLMKQGTVEGRLVIGIKPEGKDMVFYSETVMWKRQNDKTVMPLEMAVVRWLHEVTAWWLLESGTRYLVGLREES